MEPDKCIRMVHIAECDFNKHAWESPHWTPVLSGKTDPRYRRLRPKAGSLLHVVAHHHLQLLPRHGLWSTPGKRVDSVVCTLVLSLVHHLHYSS